MPGKKMDPLKKMHDTAMKKMHAASTAMKAYHTAAKKMHDSAMKMAHGKSPAKNKHYGATPNKFIKKAVKGVVGKAKGVVGKLTRKK